MPTTSTNLITHELVHVLTVGDLKAVHPFYTFNYLEWNFLNAAYEGTRALVACGYLERHERESIKNWNRRTKEAFGFNYSRSVVDLFNFYLFKEPVKRILGALQTDPSWLMFNKDCNLYGDEFDEWMTEQSRYASINGHMGILIDKSSNEFDTVAQELENKVYPYVASYFPTAILDWEYARDENNRPFLAYIKLLDDTHDHNQYRMWWPHWFQVWELPDLDEKKCAPTAKCRLVFEGPNPLGEIPFVWLYNMRSKIRPIGVSDIGEVSRIDVSILRNLSHGEEVITYAAFPMMRKPMQEARPDNQSAQKDDEVGVTAILEFDPEHPESKPDWLDSSVGEPIDAILEWIARKVSEIYRATNVGGQAGMEISTTAKSGAALKAEFQLLNSNLIRKATNLENAENEIMRFWLKWQKKDELLKEISVERARTYDVENLASDLENSLTASALVRSKKFRQFIQKAIARQMLPALEDDALKEIDEEIDNAVEELVGTPPAEGPGSLQPLEE